MVMRFLRQMPVMRALLVAFVVLFVFGGTSEVFGRTYMQNGHEGDPTDGLEIVGGGGGGDDIDLDQDNIELGKFEWDVGHDRLVGSGLVYFEPLVIDGELFLIVIFDGSGGKK